MIRIYADSTNDLGPELIERYHIRIIPLYVNMGDRTYTDWRDITPDEIYEWSDANNTTPTTKTRCARRWKRATTSFISVFPRSFPLPAAYFAWRRKISAILPTFP